MARDDERLGTPAQLDDTQLARVKQTADRDLEALAHAMQRYAAAYLAHRTGEMADAPNPATVGCDEHSAGVARAVVEYALNAEVHATDGEAADAAGAQASPPVG